MAVNKKLNENVSLQDLCRLCGHSKDRMKLICDKKNVYDYLKIINTYFRDFHVKEVDSLPLNVCTACSTTLLTWHKFYISCIVVNRRLLFLQDKMEKRSSLAEVNGEEEEEEEVEIKDEKCEYFVDECDNDIEVIEVKIDDTEYEFEDVVYENPDIDNDLVDIANIPVNEDVSSELIILGNASNEIDPLKERTLDNEELAILEKDLKTTTPGFEHLAESSNTVGKPTPKFETTPKLDKSTMCRICGKLYINRSSYLRHLMKVHSNHIKRKKILVNTNTAIHLTSKVPIITSTVTVNPPMTSQRDSENEARMCHMCGKIFRHSSTYRQHVKDKHSEGGPEGKVSKKRSSRMCDLCGKLCSGGTFREHMRKHTNPESVTCEHCGQIFSFVSVLKSHIQVRHSNDRPFKCNVCESAFKRADYLRSHMRYKHQPKATGDKTEFKCVDCDAAFRSEIGLTKHRNLRSKGDGPGQCPTSYKCSTCSAIFKKRNYLVLHKRYVHEKNKPCRISESSVGPYKCDKCERRFASVCGRNYHCKHAHGTVYDTKFNAVCDHCGLTFRNRVFYAKHRAKLRDKPTCYLCWSAFETQDDLKVHIHEEHVDDLPFLCQTCNNRFVTLRQLNDHIRSRHEFIRPFKCDYCQHASVRKDSLEVHIRSCHLGEKPFKCDLCDKAFSQSSDVRKHRLIHTRNKVTVVQVKVEEAVA